MTKFHCKEQIFLILCHWEFYNYYLNFQKSENIFKPFKICRNTYWFTSYKGIVIGTYKVSGCLFAETRIQTGSCLLRSYGHSTSDPLMYISGLHFRPSIATVLAGAARQFVTRQWVSMKIGDNFNSAVSSEIYYL